MIKSLNLQQTPGQFQAEADFCTNHGLELELATDYGWLVRAANGTHDGQVFGCIDQLRDCVELLRLDGGFHWSTFGCLHDALDNLILQSPRNHLGDELDGQAIEFQTGSVRS